ncbi:GGDEF domain-containing protein [Tumebacillus sp. ITR2]|uniref:GGDEF domain-containing protein n=1 Tax=Tumebacillus amylolyticus TaxID=2801339 RepID=A0ABS1JA91_9BACL|nr:GGDEF domain-containing protein [Tumebacillus amylolyticus]MBL0386533.1 GGDEF domain-containing protein [Tumebacillus amylolyticus]
MLKTLRYSSIAYGAVVLLLCVLVPQLLVESPIRRILFGIGVLGICVLGIRVTRVSTFSLPRLLLYTMANICMTGLVYQATLVHLGIVFLHISIITYSYVASIWRREFYGATMVVLAYLYLKIIVAPHEAGYIWYWLFFDSLALLINCGIGSYLGKKDREMANLVRQLQSANELLRKRSLIDSLTGLLQKDIFRQEVEDRIQGLSGADSGYLFFFDVDDFKRVNDTYGHPFGDLVLQGVASVLLEEAADSNSQTQGHAHGVAGRFGGEEMVLFRCHLDETGARQLAERLRARIASLRFATVEGKIVSITASIGAACARLDSDYEFLMETADHAMYAVKKNGKNGHRFDSDLTSHPHPPLHTIIQS